MKIATFALALLLLLAPQVAQANTYTIDPDHTKIYFKVKHMGISNVVGHFGDFDGTFTFDPKNIAASKASAKIKTASIDTDNQKRDDHLRSPEFLDASKNPQISFATKEIRNIKGDTFTAVGELTVNGVSLPVELDTEFGGAAKDPWGNERAAFTATTKINRKDFGLTWNKLLETGGLLVGEDVMITIEVEGIKK